MPSFDLVGVVDELRVGIDDIVECVECVVESG
jgi:hypothetical protein